MFETSDMTAESESRLSAANAEGRPKLRVSPGGLALVLVILATATVAGGVHWRHARPSERFARGLAALDARRFDEVRREIEALKTVEEYEPHRHFLQAALLLERGQYRRALDEFGKCLGCEELRVGTLTLAGRAAYQAGHLQDAVGLLEQALGAEPDAAEAMRWLASAYYDLGVNNRAVYHLNRLAELEPENPRPHRLMALIHKDFENYAAAIEAYRESLRRSRQQPDGDAILLELAECEIKTRQLDSALADLAGCRPGPERWAKEAECHYGLGRVEEARRLLEQALAEEPAHLPSMSLLGTIALDQKDAATAVAWWSRAAIAYPRDYLVRFKLSQACRRMGKTAEADQQAQLAEEIRAMRMEFSKLHQQAEAEPENADVRCRLGKLARDLDRPDLARVWFRAALAINPRHEEAIRLLAGHASEQVASSDPKTRVP